MQLAAVFVDGSGTIIINASPFQFGLMMGNAGLGII
jgi:hypothetical protein